MSITDKQFSGDHVTDVKAMEDTIGELAVKLVVIQTRKARLHRELNATNDEEQTTKRELSDARRRYADALGESLGDGDN